MVSKFFKEYIKEVEFNDIEEYHDTSHGRLDFLRGIRFKKFVRFDSKIFKELIDEIINNPNCSYETYVNDLIKSGYIPKHISVLKKEDNSYMDASDRYGLGHFKDVCASRFLNFFESPTTYESVIQVGQDIFSCSVDFGRYGEDFYTVASIPLIHSTGADSIEENIVALRSKLNWFSKHKNIASNTQKMIDQYIEDYVYARLIREHGLGDTDGGFHNVGLIHNVEENTFRMAPNFDLEYCFSITRDTSHRWRELKGFLEDLTYVKDIYPKVFKKFMDKLHGLVSMKNGKTKAGEIIESVIGENVDSAKFIRDANEHLYELVQIADSVAGIQNIIK